LRVTDKARLAETRTEETKRFIRDIRRVTRRRFTAEEKIRIVLEGFRHDTPIRDLCRREGIRPTTYYAWLKEFMEAGKEYRRKTKSPNELWATDCAYLRVMNWGWYYLVTVMDDFSRYILAWDLKSDMAAGSLIDVVQQAVDATGMSDVPMEDRTALLSDNGPGYLSRQFGEYLRLVGIRHIIASPYHPQTNGKMERYHRTLRGDVGLVSYDMPSELEAAIRPFVHYYNYQRYHEGLGNITPYDAYTSRYVGIIQQRKEVKIKTLQARKNYNRAIRKQDSSLSSVR